MRVQIFKYFKTISVFKMCKYNVTLISIFIVMFLPQVFAKTTPSHTLVSGHFLNPSQQMDMGGRMIRTSGL